MLALGLTKRDVRGLFVLNYGCKDLVKRNASAWLGTSGALILARSQHCVSKSASRGHLGRGADHEPRESPPEVPIGRDYQSEMRGRLVGLGGVRGARGIDERICIGPCCLHVLAIVQLFL